MDTGKKQQAVLYIEGGRLFFLPGPGGQMTQLAFPSDIMSDLEVLSSQKLVDLILLTFGSQKIPPSDILFVFASAITFEKEFALEENKEVVQRFLDYVPFDDILSKTFTINKKNRVIAVNGELYTILKQAFEKVHCTSAGAVPYSLLTTLIPELAQKVDVPAILSRFDSCKQFNMVGSTTTEEVAPSQKPVTNKEKDKKTTYLLVGVFSILIIVLVIVVVANLSPAPKSQLTPKTLPAVLPTATIVPATPSAEVTHVVSPSSPATNPTGIKGE